MGFRNSSRIENRAIGLGTWWNEPRAVNLNGIIYVGGVKSDGDIIAAQVDPDEPWSYTSVDLNSDAADDHNNPGLLIESGKPPIVAYQYHGADQLIRVRKGTTAGDLSTLGSESTLTVTGSSGVTYTILWRRPGTDEVWVVCRHGGASSTDNWKFFKSTDYGDTWGSPVDLVDRTNLIGGYIGSVQVGSTVRVPIAKHPVHDDNRIWYCEIDLDSGDITIPSDGSTIGNLDGTGLPFDPTTDCDLIYTASDPGLRLLAVSSRSDANGGPQIGVVTWDDDTSSGNTYRVIDYDSGSWTEQTVTEAGAVIGYTASTHYHAGIEFPWDGDNELFVARDDSGTWRIELWTESGGTWSLDKEYKSSSTRTLLRPQAAVNGGFMWYEAATYPDFETYTDPTIEVRANV